MVNWEMIVDCLANQEAQQVLNQALFHLISGNGGDVTIPLDVMGKTAGGIVVEVDPGAGTLTLKAISLQEAEEEDSVH
jgi:hypothetical protein